MKCVANSSSITGQSGRDLEFSVLIESQQIKEQIQSESTKVKSKTLYLMLQRTSVLECWTPANENCFIKAREGTGASLKQNRDRYEAEKLYRPECTWRMNHITIKKLHRENLHDSAMLLQLHQDFTCCIGILLLPRSQFM